jgi:hypothetical protein
MDTNYINLKFKIYIKDKDNITYYLTPNSDKFFEYVKITDGLPNNEYIVYNKDVIKSRMEEAGAESESESESESDSVNGGKRMINNHTLRKTLKKLKRKINKTLRVI